MDNERFEATLWFDDSLLSVDKMMNAFQTIIEKYFGKPYVVFPFTRKGGRGVRCDSAAYSFITKELASGEMFNFIVDDHAKGSIKASLSVSVNLHKVKGKMIEQSTYNMVSFSFDTNEINTDSEEDAIISSIKELIVELDPVIAALDSNMVGSDMLKRAGELTCEPLDRIQTVYWANYFGKEYCKLYPKEWLLEIPCYKAELLANGVWLQVSDSLKKTSWHETKANRKNIAKALSISLWDKVERSHSYLVFKGDR